MEQSFSELVSGSMSERSNSVSWHYEASFSEFAQWIKRITTFQGQRSRSYRSNFVSHYWQTFWWSTVSRNWSNNHVSRSKGNVTNVRFCICMNSQRWNFWSCRPTMFDDDSSVLRLLTWRHKGWILCTSRDINKF